MRDFYTIYHACWGKAEHATTAEAAVNKAVKMCAYYSDWPSLLPATIHITVDRGRGKTTSKVYNYGTVKATDSGYVFTPDNKGEQHVL